MDNSPQTRPIGSPLVLVVDDDEDTRLNLSDILELKGYRVDVAGSARELSRAPIGTRCRWCFWTASCRMALRRKWCH